MCIITDTQVVAGTKSTVVSISQKAQAMAAWAHCAAPLALSRLWIAICSMCAS